VPTFPNAAGQILLLRHKSGWIYISNLNPMIGELLKRLSFLSSPTHFALWFCSYWAAQLDHVDVERVSSNRSYIELDFNAVTWKHEFVGRQDKIISFLLLISTYKELCASYVFYM